MTVHIIYLAAGSSRRFGENKLLYELNGKPIFRHCLDKLSELNGDTDITVVSVYNEILDYAKKHGFRSVLGKDSEKGISYSIKSAINSFENISQDDYFMFIVADQPYLSIESVKKVLNEIRCGAELVCASYGGVPGNPVAFSAKYLTELSELSGDKGGKSIINSNLTKCVFVEVSDKNELFDIDIKKNIL